VGLRTDEEHDALASAAKAGHLSCVVRLMASPVSPESIAMARAIARVRGHTQVADVIALAAEWSVAFLISMVTSPVSLVKSLVWPRLKVPTQMVSLRCAKRSGHTAGEPHTLLANRTPCRRTAHPAGEPHTLQANRTPCRRTAHPVGEPPPLCRTAAPHAA
jgi:hypothetical protein